MHTPSSTSQLRSQVRQDCKWSLVDISSRPSRPLHLNLGPLWTYYHISPHAAALPSCCDFHPRTSKSRGLKYRMHDQSGQFSCNSDSCESSIDVPFCSGWHMAFCSLVGFVCIRVLKITKSHNMSYEDYMRRVLPIGLLYAASLWMSNASYIFCALPLLY